MKKFLTLLVFLAALSAGMAQDKPKEKEEPEMETLLGGFHGGKIGGYGAFEVKATPFKGSWGVMTGGRGLALLDGTIGIGGGGYSLATNHTYNVTRGAETFSYKLDVSYGGVYVEYINSTKSALHFTVGGLIGGGSTSANGSGFDRGISESSPFFVIEPALSAEINMTRFVRIAAGASYRVILGADMDDDVFKSTDLSGPSVNLTFKFGWFDGFNLPGFFRHLHKDDDGKEEW